MLSFPFLVWGWMAIMFQLSGFYCGLYRHFMKPPKHSVFCLVWPEPRSLASAPARSPGSLATCRSGPPGTAGAVLHRPNCGRNCPPVRPSTEEVRNHQTVGRGQGYVCSMKASGHEAVQNQILVRHVFGNISLDRSTYPLCAYLPPQDYAHILPPTKGH